MLGYVCIGALAAFGLIAGVWITCGFFLPGTKAGITVLQGPLTEENLAAARRLIWLREMGLLLSPLLAREETLDEGERIWLECHGFEICGGGEIARQLGIGETDIGTGVGYPSGCHQRRGVSEL